MIDTPSDTTTRPRIALAHDWLCGRRGGEHVLEHIAQIVESHYAPAGVYVMFADGRPIGPSIDRFKTHVSSVGRLPGASGRARRWLLPAFPRAVRNLGAALARDHQREPIDLLISTSSAAIKSLKAPPGVTHLCYCHSPARYVWSRQDEYTSGGGLAGLGLRIFGPSFRAWDVRAANNVDHFVANSTYTANQIRASYARDATVVHPPVETTFYTPDESTKREDYWLVVAALEPYKRVDLAIRAANASRQRLVVVGDGTQRESLEQLAGPTVTFAGRIDDEALREHYRRAKLLLFPQIEDFGIIAVEAQACGCPVVACGTGGASDIVVDGQTGSFFSEPNIDALLEAAKDCPEDLDTACTHNAQRFTATRFSEQFSELIARCLRGQI